MTQWRTDSIGPSDSAASSKRRRPSRAAKFNSDVAVLEAAPVSGAWLNRLRNMFSDAVMDRGLEGAQTGLVRRVEIVAGQVSGQVRSEAGDTRKLCISVPAISEEQWDRLIEAMSGEALYAACLLERRWPPGFDATCATHGVHLIPLMAESLRVTWDIEGHPEQWRAAAIGWLAAEKFAADPLLMLEVRGQQIERLSDRLRQQRVLMTRGGAAAHPEPPLAADVLSGPSLHACVNRFWRLGPDFDEARRPAELDHIPHALLRRLGPSTMEGGKFPLSGLLATIYDTVAQDARQLREGPPPGGSS